MGEGGGTYPIYRYTDTHLRVMIYQAVSLVTWFLPNPVSFFFLQVFTFSSFSEKKNIHSMYQHILCTVYNKRLLVEGESLS